MGEGNESLNIFKENNFGETWGDEWHLYDIEFLGDFFHWNLINSDLGKVGGSQIAIKEGEKEEEWKERSA